MNKTILKQLENIKEKLENEIEKRENTYYERSEVWQDSEKGENYSDKTLELDDVLGNVDLAIDDLTRFLES